MVLSLSTPVGGVTAAPAVGFTGPVLSPGTTKSYLKYFPCDAVFNEWFPFLGIYTF